MLELAPDGSPIVKLPPDLRPDMEVLAAPTNLWHFPSDIWGPLRKLEDGSASTVAVLDTGMNSHDVLPEPIAAESFISGESWRDGNGHGTHCAGTILGREGIGCAHASRLIVGKVLSNSGSGSSEAIARGIRWATDAGADIISMSLGGGGPYAPMEQAIKYAWSKGTICVAAAGNAGFRGTQNTIGYPARYFDCLCIGAYRIDGQRASFSSGGRELDICCPGQDIISCSTRNGYVSMSGTSMATPYAAGLFALIVSMMKKQGKIQFTGAEAVREFLKINTIDKGDPGHDPWWGLGIPRPFDIVNAMLNRSLVYV